MSESTGQVRYEPDPTALAHVFSELAKRDGETDAVLVPTVDQLNELVGGTFWASLERDEGRPVLPRAGFFESGSATDYRFSGRVPFTSGELVRLASTLPPNGAVGVSAASGSHELSIWGTSMPAFRTAVVDAIAPGVLVISVGHPLILLRRDRANVIDRGARQKAHDLLVGVAVPGEIGDRRARNVLLRLARSIGRLNHGGTVLIVPAGSPDWRRYVEASPRDAQEPYRLLSEAMVQSYDARERLDSIDTRTPLAMTDAIFLRSQRPAEAQARVQDAIDEIAALTNIDGAIVIDAELNVLSFGAKIACATSPAGVRVVEPVVGASEIQVALDHLGGMRHQSVAKFVHAMDGASAIVVSQDGPISIFSREGGEVTQLTGVEFLR